MYVLASPSNQHEVPWGKEGTIQILSLFCHVSGHLALSFNIGAPHFSEDSYQEPSCWFWN